MFEIIKKQVLNGSMYLNFKAWVDLQSLHTCNACVESGFTADSPLFSNHMIHIG